MVSRGSERPVIGLTSYRQQAQTGVWDVEASFLPAVYLDAITAAGGIAVLLPPQPADDDGIDAVLDRIDGLIVTGGRDVQPERYGQERHPETDAPTPYRDDWEDSLLTRAIQREPDGDGGKPRARIADRLGIFSLPAQPRVLNGILRARHFSQHAVGDTQQMRTMLLEKRGRLIFHAAFNAWFTAMSSLPMRTRWHVFACPKARLMTGKLRAVIARNVNAISAGLPHFFSMVSRNSSRLGENSNNARP